MLWHVVTLTWLDNVISFGPGYIVTISGLPISACLCCAYVSMSVAVFCEKTVDSLSLVPLYPVLMTKNVVSVFNVTKTQIIRMSSNMLPLLLLQQVMEHWISAHESAPNLLKFLLKGFQFMPRSANIWMDLMGWFNADWLASAGRSSATLSNRCDCMFEIMLVIRYIWFLNAAFELINLSSKSIWTCIVNESWAVMVVQKIWHGESSVT